MTPEYLDGNLTSVMLGALTEGKLVHVETDHYATVGDVPASIRIVHNINEATHIVVTSYYDAEINKTIFEFERIKRHDT